jgi:glyceraldehyde 3-phosphate dehydrogenase
MTIKVGINGFDSVQGRWHHQVNTDASDMLANASLTDIIFDVKRDTTAEEVNNLLKEASQVKLQGILGFEERPLVSIDSRMVKIYAWHDNEMGYATRTAKLVRKVGLA